MSELQIKLDELQNEKAAKLKPEYLKDGHICMGVLGTLKEGVDTSDATATANDIAQYKTAYINGEKVEGTVWDGRPGATNITGEEPHIGVNLENVQYHIDEDIASFGGWLEFKGRFNTSCILDERCVLVMDEEGMHVADAIGLTGDKIVSGNTILGVEGTAESGIDTSDATATPDDIISGKTAYVNGEKVEGTILDIGEGLSVGFQYENVVNIGPENGLYITSVHPDDVTFAIRKNAQVTTYLPYADTANIIGLTGDKIVSGNTILGIEGTAEAGGNTCIQTESGQYQNIAILKQDYQPVLLDDVLDDDYEGDDTGVTGRIIGCVIDDSDFKITMDFIKDGWWIGLEDPVMAIKFYNDNGEELPELCMYDVVMEGLGTTLTTGKAVATALLTSPLDWQRVIQSATSYKLYFTSF